MIQKFKEDAKSILPTPFGVFNIFVFSEKSKEHVVLVKGNLKDSKGVLVRIHSECLTGDALFSQRCDCRAQLEKSFKIIGKSKTGMIIYLRQEGRGIGLLDKIRAYALQEKVYDTREANQKLGLPIDARNYTIAEQILNFFKIQKVRLLTNNPEKLKALGKNIKIVERVELKIKANQFNKQYLKTKQLRFGHLLND